MRISQLEVAQVHADLQAVARLTLTADEVRALNFTAYYDELGPGVHAFVQLDEGTFRLWNNSTDPAGRSLVVLATPGEPLPSRRAPARLGPARSRARSALERPGLADRRRRGLSLAQALYCRSM